ncbi:hypothetical protein Pmar_PMAR008364 [Perkinsus marinus ATCC 50983]|nr:hypothetical protein Pmar_PMAR008364 [Perkinsus marinus ATCC 50983]EER10141.1 hypothetical protein Pmar_PMAR008364 [Perkinsus marinus ATCC 50983]|eukprot:XP_002778346.1 hypothetical protein Pmar_PMAR008364 [Perkinsus marinus ATCC 50983]
MAKYHDDLSIRASEAAAEARSKSQSSSRSNLSAETKRRGQKQHRKGGDRREPPNKKPRGGEKGANPEATSSTKAKDHK